MSLKKTYAKDKKSVTITFTVSAEAANGAEKITVAGDFNSWSSTEDELKKGKDGSFSIKKKLPLGDDEPKEYQFRYLIDGKCWENDWEADKYVPAPFSQTDNSVVVV